MSRTLFTCHACGEKIQRKNAKFCPQCQAPLDINEYNEWVKNGNKPMPNGWVKPEPTPVPEPEPEPVPEPEPAPEPDPEPTEKKKEETIMEKKFNVTRAIFWLIVLVIVLLAAGYVFNRLTPTTDATQSADTDTIPAQTSNFVVNEATNSNYEKFAFNEQSDPDLVDQTIYDEPYEAGVMVTDDATQTVWYAQTGKTGTATLHGYIKEGQILAIDANILKLPGKRAYKNGSIKFLAGPLDLETYKVTMTNGAAQLVKPKFAQAFLDYNMAVKFARGNWNQEKGQFSYKAWDLQKDQIWTLDYTYHSLVGKLNAKNDTYPK